MEQPGSVLVLVVHAIVAVVVSVAGLGVVRIRIVAVGHLGVVVARSRGSAGLVVAGVCAFADPPPFPNS